ncbi:MAG: hypothetical protein HQL78_13150, partial [Magnetococcales bacterium]|nr:hypothetical protein [Magnetococcales bacterium]
KDGLLVLDQNGDGIVSSVREVVSEFAVPGATSSLGALATFDNNHDGKIDANDAIFSQLRAWVNQNQDGICIPQELFTLSELGISSLNLTLDKTGPIAMNGNTINGFSKITYADGHQGTMAEVVLNSDARSSEAGAKIVDVEWENGILEFSNNILPSNDNHNNSVTLRFVGSSMSLDLAAAYKAGMVKNIEFIDLTGTGHNNLSLTYDSVSRIVATGTDLRIVGDHGDTVHMDSGWTCLANYTSMDGHLYHHYVQGGVSLLVSADIDTYHDSNALDLNSDGTGLTDQDHRVHFDMNLTGKPQATGWIAPSDALLALDLNHDGVINNARELFSEYVFKDVHSGKEALAKFDANQDHLIDAKDPVFKDIFVWRDGNLNGISEAGELSTLAQKEISSIQLDTTTDSHWQGSNQVLTDGHFTYTDGHMGQLAEATLQSGGPGATVQAEDLFGHLLQSRDALYADVFSSRGVDGPGLQDQGVHPSTMSSFGQQSVESSLQSCQMGGVTTSSAETAGKLTLDQALTPFLQTNHNFSSGPDACGLHDTLGQIDSLSSLMKSGTHGDHMVFLDSGLNTSQDYSSVDHDPDWTSSTHWHDGVPPIEDVLHHPVHVIGV